MAMTGKNLVSKSRFWKDRRSQWLARPPSIEEGDPWHAFRSVSYKWVNNNPNSRENVARIMLEQMFAKPFPKVRPSFLRNPETNRCLEIDGFNSELKIGFEFMGEQHTQYPNPFHSTYAQFAAQCKRDVLKIKLCKEFKVKLIFIPHTIQRNDIEAFLQLQLQNEIYAMQLIHKVELEDEDEILMVFGRINLNTE